MAHVGKILSTLLIRRKFNNYVQLKDASVRLHEQGLKPVISITDRISTWWMKYFCCGWTKEFFHSGIRRRDIIIVNLYLIYKKLTTTGTFLNRMTVIILGFLSGILLTYFYFTFLSIVLDFSIPVVFWLSVGLCISCTIGLAFSEFFRGLTLSITPELLTQKTRTILVSFAFILLLQGPGANIFYNTRELTDCTTCTRQQVSGVARNLTELYLKPARAIKQALIDLKNTIRKITSIIAEGLKFILNIIRKVVSVITAASKWLKSIIDICNKEKGTVEERCVNLFTKAVPMCKDNDTHTFWDTVQCVSREYTNKALNLISNSCAALRLIDVLCDFVSFVKTDLLVKLKDVLSQIKRQIVIIFFFKIHFIHDYYYTLSQTKSIKQALRDIFEAQKRRYSFLGELIHAMVFIFGLGFPYLIFTAYLYRRKFLKNMYFDNIHINRFVTDLDYRRAAARAQTIFPLTASEKTVYVSLTSPRYTIKEWKNFTRNILFLVYSGLKMLYMFAIDLILVWILTLLKNHGRVHFYFGNDRSKIKTDGKGFWHAVYKTINGLLSPWDLSLSFDTLTCLPNPRPIDYETYKRVLYIMFFALITVLIQPWGLRFRNWVMCMYHPSVARRRAVWMYNYILQNRGNMSLLIRKHLLGRNPFGVRSTRPNLLKILVAKFPLLRICLPYKREIECTVCGYSKPKIKCATPDCNAFYCKDCFDSVNRTCLACNMPQDYEHFEVTEEEDSEEDEVETITNSMENILVIIPTPKKSENLQLVNMRKRNPQPYAKDDKIFDNIKSFKNKYKKDYFGESWKKLGWARIDDYEIPLPDFNKWARHI